MYDYYELTTIAIEGFVNCDATRGISEKSFSL